MNLRSITLIIGSIIFLLGIYTNWVAGAFAPIFMGIFFVFISFFIHNNSNRIFMIFIGILFLILGITGIGMGIRDQFRNWYTVEEKTRKLFTYGLIGLSCLAGAWFYFKVIFSKRPYGKL